MDESSLTDPDLDHLDELIKEGKKKDVIRFIEENKITRELYKKSNVYADAPIYTAAKYGHTDIVDYLTKRGLDFRFDGGYSRSPLQIAAKYGHLALVKSLIKDHGYDVNDCTQDGKTPLFLTAKSGTLKMVKYLVKSGAGVNLISKDGSTPVHRAVIGKQTEICEYILTQGFKNINARDVRGHTALSIAVATGASPLIHLLVDYGADINLGNNENVSPLWIAVHNYNLEILKYLYSHGADPEAENTNGTTPLLTAVTGPYIDMVHYLAVTVNVSPSRKSLFLKSPLSMSLLWDQWKIAMLLLQVGCEVKGTSNDLLSKSLDRCKDEHIHKYMAEVLSTPRTLVDTCCFYIRRLVGRDISVKTDSLPLPPKLINYVKLTHVRYN